MASESTQDGGGFFLDKRLSPYNVTSYVDSFPVGSDGKVMAPLEDRLRVLLNMGRSFRSKTMPSESFTVPFRDREGREIGMLTFTPKKPILNPDDPADFVFLYSLARDLSEGYRFPSEWDGKVSSLIHISIDDSLRGEMDKWRNTLGDLSLGMFHLGERDLAMFVLFSTTDYIKNGNYLHYVRPEFAANVLSSCVSERSRYERWLFDMYIEGSLPVEKQTHYSNKVPGCSMGSLSGGGVYHPRIKKNAQYRQKKPNIPDKQTNYFPSPASRGFCAKR